MGHCSELGEDELGDSFLGEDVPDQQQVFLHAAKLIFTASESWLGKKADSNLWRSHI